MSESPNLDVPTEPRVVVVGTSSAGKSFLAARLAAKLRVPHVELDQLFWGPGWQPKPADEFARLVAESTRGPSWVADGNYSPVREVLWPRANVIIWLNYSFALVLWRGIKRSVGRSLRRSELWHGNRESLRRTFLSRDSILLWIVSTYHRRQREFDELRASRAYPDAAWLEFRHPRQADKWLAGVKHAG